MKQGIIHAANAHANGRERKYKSGSPWWNAEDRERGEREAGLCDDCGGMLYYFFYRPSWSWSERAKHRPGENCVQNLRKRIEMLEARNVR